MVSEGSEESYEILVVVRVTVCKVSESKITMGCIFGQTVEVSGLSLKG